jgi:hypothetical protein
MNTDKDPYDLNELIQKLEDIRDLKDERLNHPRAFYTLALEIKELKSVKTKEEILEERIESLEDTIKYLVKAIPIKYRKAFWKIGENPYLEAPCNETPVEMVDASGRGSFEGSDSSLA